MCSRKFKKNEYLSKFVRFNLNKTGKSEIHCQLMLS